jgi:hypothetical protein
MKKLLLTFLLTLTACPVAHEKGIKASTHKRVNCIQTSKTSPATIEYSSINDTTRTMKIYIFQGSDVWTTNLNKVSTNPNVWRTNVEFNELNCNKRYSYDIDML